jgi:sulfur-carrier protein
MGARVVFTAGISRRYTGGVREFEVEARNLRGVIKAMDQLYPGLGHHLEEETTVAIDGAIHETAYFQPIRPGCEIFFIPKLEGGGRERGLWSKALRPPPRAVNHRQNP